MGICKERLGEPAKGVFGFIALLCVATFYIPVEDVIQVAELNAVHELAEDTLCLLLLHGRRISDNNDKAAMQHHTLAFYMHILCLYWGLMTIQIFKAEKLKPMHARLAKLPSRDAEANIAKHKNITSKSAEYNIAKPEDMSKTKLLEDKHADLHCSILNNMLKEVASSHILHDQKDAVLGSDDFYQVDNVGVLHLLHEMHFTHDFLLCLGSFQSCLVQDLQMCKLKQLLLQDCDGQEMRGCVGSILQTLLSSTNILCPCLT